MDNIPEMNNEHIPHECLESSPLHLVSDEHRVSRSMYLSEASTCNCGAALVLMAGVHFNLGSLPNDEQLTPTNNY